MSQSQSVRATLDDRVEDILVTPHNNGNKQRAHVPHPNGGPMCRDKMPDNRVARLQEKSREVYPDGWLNWCKDCIGEVKRDE